MRQPRSCTLLSTTTPGSRSQELSREAAHSSGRVRRHRPRSARRVPNRVPDNWARADVRDAVVLSSHFRSLRSDGSTHPGFSLSTAFGRGPALRTAASARSTSPGIHGPVTEPLSDPAYFRQVPVDPQLGAIVWRNGSEMELEKPRWRSPTKRLVGSVHVMNEVARHMPELDLLGAVAPAARAALVRAWRVAHDAVDPGLLDLARRRVEDHLGLAPDPGEEPDEPLGRAIAELSDQFVFYVPHVTEELRTPVRDRLGPDGLRTFVEALYVLDQTTRLRLTHARLFAEDESPPPGQSDPGRASSLRSAVTELHAEAVRLDGLDPITTEVVRLRAANYHDCKT